MQCDDIENSVAGAIEEPGLYAVEEFPVEMSCGAHKWPGWAESCGAERKLLNPLCPECGADGYEN